MGARVANITFYAEDPAALARFWGAVMSEDDIDSTAEAWDQDPTHQRFYFQRYLHTRRQRNRMHIDITPFDDRRATRAEVEAECERLVALGASVEKVLTDPWGPFEEFAIMMRDPEGNQFCLQ